LILKRSLALREGDESQVLIGLAPTEVFGCRCLCHYEWCQFGHCIHQHSLLQLGSVGHLDLYLSFV